MFERFAPTGRGVLWFWLRTRPGCSSTTTSAPSTSCSDSYTRAKVSRPEALGSLARSLDAVRRQVEEIIGQGQEAPSGALPFTPRAKKVLELSLRESKQLGHNYIGTEHILLGLIREGSGVAAQVLVKLGADLHRVRQQVIQLLHGRAAERPGPGVQVRPEMFEQRLRHCRVGIGPDTSDLDEQIEVVRAEKEAAIDAQDFEQAVSLRDRETQLLAAKAARREQWAAEHPAQPDLAERSRQPADEVERLRALLRQHGIDPKQASQAKTRKRLADLVSGPGKPPLGQGRPHRGHPPPVPPKPGRKLG